VFWVMYLMFVLVAAGGLIATAQLAPIAKDFKIADVPWTSWGWSSRRSASRSPSTDPERSHAALLRLGLRPHRPRVTMFIAFALEGAGILALTIRPRPGRLRRADGPVFFAWARSTASSPLRAQTRSAASTPLPTPACSTPRRAPRRCWCRSRARSPPLPAAGTPCSWWRRPEYCRRAHGLVRPAADAPCAPGALATRRQLAGRPRPPGGVTNLPQELTVERSNTTIVRQTLRQREGAGPHVAHRAGRQARVRRLRHHGAGRGIATSPAEAARLAADMGFPSCSRSSRPRSCTRPKRRRARRREERRRSGQGLRDHRGERAPL